LRKSNGNEFRASLPLVGIHQHFRDSPNLRGGMRMHSLISWVGSQLSENYKFIAHSTDAAASGFFDIRQHEWSEISVGYFPKELNFPAVTNEVVAIGTNSELSCPVFTAIGDQQSSLLGVGLNENQIAVNIGTGGQIAKVVTEFTEGQTQQRPYFNSRFIQTKTHLPAGRTITEFLSLILDKLPISSDYDWMNSQSLTANQFEEMEVINIRTEVLKLSFNLNPNKAALAANVIESIAGIYGVEIGKIREIHDTELLMAGGIGTRMTRIGRILSEKLDMELKFVDTEETTLQGLANLIVFIKDH